MNQEQAFLHQYQQIKDQYEKPSITTDVITFAISKKHKGDLDLQTLLVKRTEHPFINKWSLPGGFMQIYETLEETAHRVIQQKTGLTDSYIEQLYTFSDVERDPRMRIVSASYLNLMNKKEAMIATSKEAAWFNVSVVKKETVVDEKNPTIVRDHYQCVFTHQDTVLKALLKVTTTMSLRLKQEIEVLSSDLAFDHAKMVLMAFLRIQNKIEYTNIAFHLMPMYFSLPDLQRVYELFLQKELYKTSFRKQIASMVQETQYKETPEGFSKPAKLYQSKHN